MTPAGLYLHIPFCKSKCPYCHFYSVTDTSLIPSFLEAVQREMARYPGHFSVFDTIYIGGGTPSLLASGQVAEILAAILRTYSVTPDAEITMEVNPHDGDAAWFRDLRRLGINRIHLGAQSFSPAALTFLGRRHRVADIYRTVDSIFKAGFTNFGLDLIYGLPGQEPAAWKETLAAALELTPPHLSCYQLTAEDETPLAADLRRGLFHLPGEERSRAFFLDTSSLLTAAGYHHYEIANFARRPELRSRHNRKYWEHKPYLGLGPAAHSFREGRRWWNTGSITDYLTALHAGQLPPGGEEILSADELRLETIFLGLRTAAGIDLPAFQKIFRCDLMTTHRRIIDALIAGGLLRRDGRRLIPTVQGMAVADRLALML